MQSISRLFLLLLATVAGGLSCDNSLAPSKSGSIRISLVDLANGTPLALTLDAVRITLAGPTGRTITPEPPSNHVVAVIAEELDPGPYSVTVEGLVDGELDHVGKILHVSVEAGQTADASVPFTSFRPVLARASVTDTTDVLRFTLDYDSVPGATSYIIRWSSSPTFEAAETRTSMQTSEEISVPAAGMYFAMVRAVNDLAPAGGRPSSVRTVVAAQTVSLVGLTPGTVTLAPGATQQFSAEAKDPAGAVVPNVSYYWASSNHAVATVDQNGLATAVAGGQVTITAVGRGAPGSASLAVTPRMATKLAFSAQPTNSVAGQPFTPAIQVEIQDAGGHIVTTARDAVTLSVADNTGNAVLSGTKVVNAVNGIASFSGLSMDKAATGYVLSAASGSLTAAASAAFAVTPASVSKLLVATQPANVEGNVAITPAITVRMADVFDNTVTSATNQITLSLGDSPWRTFFSPGAVLSGGLSVAAVNGVATFSGIRVDKPGQGYTLLAKSGTLTSTTTAPFNVTLPVQHVSAGGSHTCALTTGGTYCWGDDSYGQLGGWTGSMSMDSTAVLVRGGLTFVAVSIGNGHSCGLTSVGAAYCWGHNGFGQLGREGFTLAGDDPSLVTGNHAFAQIDAGVNHTCGVTTASATPAEDRQVYCWGWNNTGQLGVGSVETGVVFTPQRVSQPLRTSTRAVRVSAGNDHTCALAEDAKIYCWGAWYAVGDGSSPPTDMEGQYRTIPTQVTGGHSWLSLSAGGTHTCAIRTDNGAWCWGQSGSGQLGVAPVPGDSIAVATTPVAVSGGLQFNAIASGSGFTCGVTAAGVAHCWGYNGEGQLGNGTLTSVAAPAAVSGSLTFTRIDAGYSHTCGVTATGTFCWGSNWSGQLGSPGGEPHVSGRIRKVPTRIIQ